VERISKLRLFTAPIIFIPTWAILILISLLFPSESNRDVIAIFLTFGVGSFIGVFYSYVLIFFIVWPILFVFKKLNFHRTFPIIFLSSIPSVILLLLFLTTNDSANLIIGVTALFSGPIMAGWYLFCPVEDLRIFNKNTAGA
jgi:hypothetical protein